MLVLTLSLALYPVVQVHGSDVLIGKTAPLPQVEGAAMTGKMRGKTKRDCSTRMRSSEVGVVDSVSSTSHCALYITLSSFCGCLYVESALFFSLA